jgi:hypothetical protein
MELLNLRSTLDSGPPPSILPLMEGGGGPEWILKSMLRSAARKQACRSMDHNGFRTPPGVLLLTEGGVQNRYFSSAGPWSYVVTAYWSSSPIPHMLSDGSDTDGRHPPLSPLVPLVPGVVSHPITAVSPCCQSFTLSTHENPLMVTFVSHHLQSLAATSTICIFSPPSPAISPPSGPLSINDWISTHCHADRFPASNRPQF